MHDAHPGPGRRQDLAGGFDYVIVGAGSAGCVVARRLVEGTEATVLVLEAGGTDEGIASIESPQRWTENLVSPHAWAYTCEPSPHLDHRSLPMPRGKVLGGSGSINAMLWAHGNRADYDGWADAGNEGWDFESVLPLFKKSEDWEDGENAFRGAGGPMRVERARDLDPVSTALIDAGRSCGMPYLDDMNIPHPEGVGPQNLNVREGRRCSPSTAFLRPAMSDETTHGPDRGAGRQAQAGRQPLRRPRCPVPGVKFTRSTHPGRSSSPPVRSTRRASSCSPASGPHPDLDRLGITTVVDLPGVGRNLQDHVLVAGLCFRARRPLPLAQQQRSRAASPSGRAGRSSTCRT